MNQEELTKTFMVIQKYVSVVGVNVSSWCIISGSVNCMSLSH